MVEKRFGRKAGLSCLALFLMASLLLVPATPVLAQNTPPVAVADVAPRTGAVPLTIHCVNPDSYDPEGGGLSWEWNFGDGSPVIGSTSATHVYTTTGIFNVTLTVTDESGLQDSDTVTINVLSTEPPPTPSPPGGQVTLQDIVVPFPGGYVPLSWGWELTPNTDYCIFYGYDAVWDTHYLVDAIQCQAYTNIRLGLDFGFRYEGQVYWPEEFDHGMFFWENEDLPLPLEVLARPDSKTEPEWMIVVTAYDGNTLTFTLDWDGDGITDNVDTERSTPSADFSDGNTSGSIISLDEGTSVLITDALDTNDGVMVVVSGPEDGDARIRIDGDAAGVLQLPPGEYIFTTYVDNHGKPALRKVIKKKLVARPVIFKRSDSKAEIKLHNVGIYSSEKRSVILEVSEGGLAEVEYNIGDTMTVVVIASGGSVELDETLTPGGTLSEVVVTARAYRLTSSRAATPTALIWGREVRCLWPYSAPLPLTPPRLIPRLSPLPVLL
jgi:PKD repeat protein